MSLSSISRPFTFDRVVRIIIGISLILGAVWLVNILSNVLLPFCLACLIAYILEPFLEFNQRLLHLKGRVLVTFITLFEVAFFIVVIAYLFLPSVIDEIHQMEDMIKAYTGTDYAPLLPKEVHEYITEHLNTDKFQELLSGQHIGAILNKGTSLITQTIDFILHTLEWFLTFIYVIFIMIDYKRLMRGFRMLVPPKYRPIAYKVGDDIKSSMNRYFRGQAILALCAAVFYCIGFSIVGIPLAIVLGILVGILYMIPYFQYITVIPVALVCFLYSLGGTESFWSLLGKCGLVYVVSQCICDYILTPKIMGKAMGLNPAIILLSLSVWGTLLGLIGMIIALPLTTLLLAYYEEYVIGDNDDDVMPVIPNRKTAKSS
ncbi:MAG: AI-2E family transporter [Duncaniella sp.]|nr:AI-2E family transporter [Muribaculum sp.]MCM1256084.1 AI-2E family transporter [Duncaniella sp.]